MMDDPFINIHSHRIGDSHALTILNIFPEDDLPDAWLSCGIHPWYTNDWEEKLQLLTKHAVDDRVLAIGECGLDTKATAPIELQRQIFTAQIQLSETMQKPLIIHCVKAFNELFSIYKKMKPTMPWIIHGFNPNQEIAKQCLELGMKLSFGKSLLSENTKTEITRNIPVSAVFFETDESEVTIANIYNRYATITGISLETLKIEMLNNFKACFKKWENKVINSL
jgi:TatD DNase family protein